MVFLILALFNPIFPTRVPPLDMAWQVNMCKKWNLAFSKELLYHNKVFSRDDLMKCDPDALETVLGDRSCYFSTLSFILICSKDNGSKIRA